MFGLNFVQNEALGILKQTGFDKKPKMMTFENFSFFGKKCVDALALIFQEKEIITFAILQWAVIGIIYYVWVQALSWIPPEVWNSDEKLNDDLLGIVFLLWSFICVAIAAFPIGILTGCIGASRMLREHGFESTIASCLKIVLPRAGSLWAFHTVDGWITVNQILNRLPKKNDDSLAEKAVQELLYYAWKVASLGIVPALLSGWGLVDAAKDSLRLIKYNPFGAMSLRFAYSAVCWVIGVAAYIGAIFFIWMCPELFHAENRVSTFYIWMGIPILAAVGIIQLFVRPIFIIASCQFYSDYYKEKKLSLPFPDAPSKFTNVLVMFLALVFFMFVVYLYREPLGLMKIFQVLK